MNKRLQALYDWITPGIGVIDVGTDHAYLPVQLALDGYPGRIIASDLRPGPLAAARRSADAAGVTDRIAFTLSDGLDGCDPAAVDTIVIAGMGGDNMVEILDRAEWCMSSRYTFLLQPMTRPEVLRYWLINNGFAITHERLVRDGQTVYQLLRAVFTGVNSPLTDAELLIGGTSMGQDRAMYAELLDRTITLLKKGLSGMEKAETSSASLPFTRALLAQLTQLRGDMS